MSTYRLKTAAILILSFILSINAMAVPSEMDTVWVDTVTAYPSGDAVVPVYFYNNVALSGVQVVLRHNEDILTPDSFSLAGGRLENIEDYQFHFKDSADLVHFAAMANFTAEENIPVGKGLFGKFYFSSGDVTPGTEIVVDSASWLLKGTGINRTMFTTAIATTVLPQFVKGLITFIDGAPNSDSVWIDSVVTSPGNQAAVSIYGKNEEDLKKIDISLVYSSDNITFTGASYTGTRSESAQKVEEANLGLRHIHISLTFGESTPLIPGEGPLATILFEIEEGSADEVSVIDSVSYLIPEGQALEFHQTEVAGGMSFAPLFSKGYVDIKSITDATDIDDDDNINLPEEFSLAQNSPNPFNPSTHIKFELPHAAHVKLYVYNILGQEVRNLIDEELTAGRHTVTFDGLNNDKRELASGVYFYRMEAGDFKANKKMILLK